MDRPDYCPGVLFAVQPFDFTTQAAVCAELQANFLPARLETVYQRDRHTLSLGLRTFEGRSWLTLCWHPQSGRIHLGSPPPREPDTFAFSQQIQSQIKGLALSGIQPICPWERALDLQFARRPDEPPLWHLYVEIMGKYSNILLVNQAQQVVTAARQVNQNQSRLREIQTGQPYSPPPGLQESIPRLSEDFVDWRSQVSLVPGAIAQNLRLSYRGLSTRLTQAMVRAAGLDPSLSSDALTAEDWQRLFDRWQAWLSQLESGEFQPGWTAEGYTVTGWDMTAPAPSVQILLEQYYQDHSDRQQFSQIHHQLRQKLAGLIAKLRHKGEGFENRLAQSDQADDYRSQADLLMAHLGDWHPGLDQIQLPDFETGKPVAIALHPEKNAVQNAQRLYKQHQKLKRARTAVTPLLEAVNQERHYLEQVDTSLEALLPYRHSADLTALLEIREELVQQGYLPEPSGRPQRRSTESPADSRTDFYRYESPRGTVLLVGRNNRQNDQLTFRVANDYDLWFHTQEIPGSHALLRLPPGESPDPEELQWAADLAARHSRAHQSEQVPVIYTEPRHVYKPKGAQPGMVIYKKERVLWGQPQRAKFLREGSSAKIR